MKLLTAFAAILGAIVANAQVSIPFNNCMSTTGGGITSVTLDPYPVCAGEEFCVTIVGTFSAPLTDPSTLTIVGTYLGVTVYSQSINLCTLITCPLPTTTVTINFCNTISPVVPVGFPIGFAVSATNDDGETLFCVAFDFAITTCSS